MAVNLHDLTFRLGTTADIPELIQLGLLSYGQYAPQLAPGGWEQMQTGIKNEAMWTHFMERGNCFLYTHEGAIVGMAFYFPSGNPWDVYPDNWAYIRMVGVHPKYEGMGIARSLTQKCIEQARNTGESVIALHTSEVMNAARHIYENLGFTIVHEMPQRFGIRYWLFQLPLSNI